VQGKEIELGLAVRKTYIFTFIHQYYMVDMINNSTLGGQGRRRL